MLVCGKISTLSSRMIYCVQLLSYYQFTYYGIVKPSKYIKVRQSQNDFFKPTFSPKKRTNEFYFTTMKPQVDLFSFVFWRKLKTPKRHLKLGNSPLVNTFFQLIVYFFSIVALQHRKHLVKPYLNNI